MREEEKEKSYAIISMLLVHIVKKRKKAFQVYLKVKVKKSIKWNKDSMLAEVKVNSHVHLKRKEIGNKFKKKVFQELLVICEKIEASLYVEDKFYKY